MSIFISWLVLIISVVCAIGIMRIINSVKKIERFFTKRIAAMILANDFLEYLLNTERDLAARVRDRYDMYLKSLPVPQLADGKIVIDGRYMIDSHEGNYRLYRIEGGTPSVIGIYQRPSSAIVDVIADSIRITHRHADTEDTVLEIQRLATVCRDTLNGMTK